MLKYENSPAAIVDNQWIDSVKWNCHIQRGENLLIIHWSIFDLIDYSYWQYVYWVFYVRPHSKMLLYNLKTDISYGRDNFFKPHSTHFIFNERYIVHFSENMVFIPMHLHGFNVNNIQYCFLFQIHICTLSCMNWNSRVLVSWDK